MTPKFSMRTILLVGLTAGLLIMLLFALWQNSRNATTKAKIGKSQAEASVESGKDAIETLGNSTGREASIDEITRNNSDEIRSAEGANAPVAPAARNAGLASLCRRAAYRDDPRCVQHAPAR